MKIWCRLWGHKWELWPVEPGLVELLFGQSMERCVRCGEVREKSA